MSNPDYKEFKNYATKHMGMSGMHLDNYMTAMYGQGPTNLTQYVIEERPTRFAQIDVFTRLIMDRIVFLGTDINDYIASILQAQLLFLSS